MHRTIGPGTLLLLGWIAAAAGCPVAKTIDTSVEADADTDADSDTDADTDSDTDSDTDADADTDVTPDTTDTGDCAGVFDVSRFDQTCFQ